LFGRLTPYRILKPLNKFRDDSQNVFLDYVNSPIRTDYGIYIYPVELRRLYVDLVWCYKILFGIVETPTEDFFVPSTYASTRGHQYKEAPMFHTHGLTFLVNVL